MPPPFHRQGLSSLICVEPEGSTHRREARGLAARSRPSPEPKGARGGLSRAANHPRSPALLCRRPRGGKAFSAFFEWSRKLISQAAEREASGSVRPTLTPESDHQQAVAEAHLNRRPRSLRGPPLLWCLQQSGNQFPPLNLSTRLFALISCNTQWNVCLDESTSLEHCPSPPRLDLDKRSGGAVPTWPA